MAGEDFYSVLGVGKTASTAEIKKAYRKLARKLHPDVNPGDKAAEERFKKVSQAHDILTNPEKRKIYDEFGEEGLQSGFDPEQARQYRQWQSYAGAGAGRGGGGRQFWRDFSFEGDNIRYSGLEDIFGEIFGAGGRRAGGPSPFGPQGPQKGRDVESSLDVDFLTAVRGGSTRVTLQAAPIGGGPPQTETIDVNIPEGVTDGSRIRLAGKGEPGADGGPPGDLYIRVQVRPHPLIKRDGDNLRMDVPVTVREAMEGAAVSVPTITGDIQLKIPPGTKAGQVMRLKGKGARNLKTKAYGDMYVTIRIQVPSTRSEEALEAARTLDRFYEGDVRRDLRI